MTDNRTDLLILHMPDRPEDVEFLKKETARLHAKAVFWYLEDCGFTAKKQLEILENLKIRITGGTLPPETGKAAAACR